MAKSKKYHYTECGLDYVYLLNGYTERITPYGKAVSITAVEQLHKIIGEAIISSPEPLSGAEIRFLRHELDWSQKRLGSQLKVEGQTVGRWERGETSIDSTADNYIRILYALYALDDSADDIKSFVDMMADLDSKKVHKELKFTKTDESWKTAA